MWYLIIVHLFHMDFNGTHRTHLSLVSVSGVCLWRLSLASVSGVCLWQRCDDFMFVRFTVSVMTKAYGKCIKSLRRVRDGLMKSHPCKPNTEDRMLGTQLHILSLLPMIFTFYQRRL